MFFFYSVSDFVPIILQDQDYKPSFAPFFFSNKYEAGSSETDSGWVSFVRLLILHLCTQYCLSVHSNSLFNFKNMFPIQACPPGEVQILIKDGRR